MRRLLATLALWPSLAMAAPLVESDTYPVDLGFDVKGFFVETFPYDHPLLPEDPFGQGSLGLRLKLDGEATHYVSWSVHHDLALTTPSETLFSEASSTGLTASRGGPELVTLSWDAGNAVGRLDRLYLRFKVPHVELTLGRQPVSFGRAYFFTPLDVVAPFTPTTLDREYKPGVDALRIDSYFGTSGRFTAVAAFVGPDAGDLSDGLVDLVVAAYGAYTVDVWDLGIFVALARGDGVVGVETAGNIGPVSVRSEVSVTMPENGDDPFVRAVLGGGHAWFDPDISLELELYAQTIGAESPDEYIGFALDPRVSRGELWTLGRWYAAASVSWQVHALVALSTFAVVNLGDPSAMVGPGVAWSVADEVSVNAGLFLGLGERPGLLTLESELGATPTVAWVSTRIYW